MKYEILLLSILIVASYSSPCTEETKPNSSNKGPREGCNGLATTNSGSTCCFMSISLYEGSAHQYCFEQELTKTYTTDITKLNELAETILKNTTGASSVEYFCRTGEDEEDYVLDNYYVSVCSTIKNPDSGDTCAAAYNETIIKKYGSHCCLLDYEYSATLHSGSGFTSPSGKACIDIGDDYFNNITELLEEEGLMHDDDDRRRRHLRDDDEDVTIKRYNVNCGTGKPSGQTNGKIISGVTSKSESGTTGITGTTNTTNSTTSDAKLLKTGVMILILSLLI